MGIAYKELFRVNRPICGPGPGGFFIKRFKEGGYSEAELLDLISGVDFSLGEVDEDISLKKKCEIVEQAVSGVPLYELGPQRDQHDHLTYGRRVSVCMGGQQFNRCRGFRDAMPDCLGNICMVSFML